MAELSVLLTRIGLTFALSFLFGLERQLRKKPVGFGPFALVATGAAVMTFVASELTNAVVVIGGIVTGVGFLGSGALLRYQDKVFGFTTAAAIWASAVFGVIMGAGFLLEGMIFYLMIAAIITIDAQFERMGLGRYAKVVNVTAKSVKALNEVHRLLPGKPIYRRSDFDTGSREYSVTFVVRGSKKDIQRLPAVLLKTRDVKRFSIE
ncbi:MAG: MgtC/SapB family protein [Candidatus Aenigmarchaeota archaeon]|nr:MgtC/SapB family protein [Candidatus Aenigmarchaeota archaeon]